MSQRAPRMLTTGTGLIALGLLLPVLERGLIVTEPVIAVLALPFVVLFLAMRFDHVGLSHAAFPASFLPAIIYLPGLFSGRAWAGVGGALTLVAIVALFGAFFTFASPASLGPPLRLRLGPLARSQAVLGIVATALLGGLVAIWLPLIGAQPSSLGVAFGGVASLALVTVVVATARRLKLELIVCEPDIARQALHRERTSLAARKKRAIMGIFLAAMTGLAGLLWYLRRGLF